MSSIAVDSLLAPVSEASPCGEDVSSGTELFVLEAEARGKPEQQYGDKVIPAVPPNWADVRDQAQALLARTRDLRIVIYLVRAAARLEGLSGYHAGLRVLRGLVESRWTELYPLTDAADGHDPYERANTLAALADRATAMADLRAARIGHDRAACTVAEVEHAFIEKPEAESQPDRASLRERIRVSCETEPALVDALTGCAAELAALEAAFAAHAPGGGPELKPTARVLGVLASIGRGLKGAAAAPAAEGVADAAYVNGASADGAAPGTSAASGASGDVKSRADAARVLGKVCDWLEANEPGHPAPLLIRRAQRLLDMNFIEIIRDMVPDSADAVERLAGGPRQ
jgi:type VI secretion system protein ImpA